MKGTVQDRPLIVWVDDDADYQHLVKEWLLPSCDVAAFSSAEAFLSELENLEPDLLLLDVKLPGPDGFQLCRRLGREPRLRQVPVLFLTSCGDDETFIRHLDTHAAGLLTKPIEKKQLLAKIKELLDGQRLESPAWAAVR
jgi:DNA-binding response OmpR family regulator